MPAGFQISVNDANNWVASAGNIENLIAGPIAAGASQNVDLVVTVVSGTPAGTITNIAEITDFEDGAGNSIANMDIDSNSDTNPGNDLILDNTINDGGTLDEDDHDIEAIEIEIVDIALIKRLAPSQALPIMIGDLSLIHI